MKFAERAPSLLGRPPRSASRRPSTASLPGALREAHARLATWGLDGAKLLAGLREYRQVQRDLSKFDHQRRSSRSQDDFVMARPKLVFLDRTGNAGIASGHYFHQDLLVARAIYARRPDIHVDVGSAIYGFVSHVASFRDIRVMDIRPLRSTTDGISFIQQDVMNLGPEYFGYADSVSCLHALEHFGLGRYGDPIDYDGWRSGLQGLTRLLQPGGNLYLGVPTGCIQRVEFNAHRVFRLPYMRDVLTQDFQIESLAFVNDQGDLLEDVDPYGPEAECSFGARYGLSIWMLRLKN